MGFFSKKPAAAAPSSQSPNSINSINSGHGALDGHAPKALTSTGVHNPRTAILSFLHEASKSSGMREFVKNYLFHSLNDEHFLVLVELKSSVLQSNADMLAARWQLLQLGAMRFAQTKGIKLTGMASVIPLDKMTSLRDLEYRAQLGGREMASEFAPTSHMPAYGSTTRQPGASRFLASTQAEGGQIEVNDGDDKGAAEEFFRLTQVPSKQ